MKKLSTSLLLLLISSVGYADTKISAMTSTTTLNAGDVFPVVANPSGTPTNNIINKNNLITTLDILTNSSATVTFAAVGTSTASLQTQVNTLSISTASLQTQVNSLNTSTAAIAASTTTLLTQSSATATYLQQSSATATYLQLSSATATYLQSSSATATYLQSSSATATYLQLSSATATYLPQSSATLTYGQLAAPNTWTASNTYTSSATFNYSSTTGGNTLFTSSVTISTGTGVAAPLPNAQSGYLRIGQGVGALRAISFFRTDTGASLGYISDALNSSFVIDNEQNASMFFATNGTTRQTITGAGGAIFANNVTVTSSVTVTAANTGAYIASFSTTALVSATTSYQIAVTTSGVFSVGPSASPVLSSCGSSPAITGTNAAFRITVGATAGGCTATFTPPLKNIPSCVYSLGTVSLVNAPSVTESNTAWTITETSLSGTIDVHCIGQNE